MSEFEAGHRVYPHVFLDANALVRLASSLSHHYIDPLRRMSRIRVLMEEGVLRVATASYLLGKADFLIREKRDISIRGDIRIVLDELRKATENNWLTIVSDEDLSRMDPVRATMYNAIASRWYRVLADRDMEDAKMLKYAAIAYVKFCVIRSRTGYYTPTYILIVSDDDDVYSNRRTPNYELIAALREVSESIHVQRHPKKLVSVAKWEKFKEYVKHLTR